MAVSKCSLPGFRMGAAELPADSSVNPKTLCTEIDTASGPDKRLWFRSRVRASRHDGRSVSAITRRTIRVERFRADRCRPQFPLDTSGAGGYNLRRKNSNSSHSLDKISKIVRNIAEGRMNLWDQPPVADWPGRGPIACIANRACSYFKRAPRYLIPKKHCPGEGPAKAAPTGLENAG